MALPRYRVTNGGRNQSQLRLGNRRYRFADASHEPMTFIVSAKKTPARATVSRDEKEVPRRAVEML